jgi:hypothetical protein
MRDCVDGAGSLAGIAANTDFWVDKMLFLEFHRRLTAPTAYANYFILAAMSGAVASGSGYVIWYAALPGLYKPSTASLHL